MSKIQRIQFCKASFSLADLSSAIYHACIKCGLYVNQSSPTIDVTRSSTTIKKTLTLSNKTVGELQVERFTHALAYILIQEFGFTPMFNHKDSDNLDKFADLESDEHGSMVQVLGKFPTLTVSLFQY